MALEIETELAGTEYAATPEELVATDERLNGEAASGEDVDETLAVFRKA
jgi:hypothetical protein